MATKEQIKRIYALGAVCGLLDRSRGSEDDLHLWIKQFSQKDHISELNERQAVFIIERLEDYKIHTQPIGEREDMTPAQKAFCFRLMHELAAVSPSGVKERERLRGIIEKVTGKNVKAEGDVFYRLSREQGSKVIDFIKRLIRSEKKKNRGDKYGAGSTDKEKPP